MKVIINNWWFIIVISTILLSIDVLGQEKKYPEVGKPIPEFQLKGGKNADGHFVTNKILLGKHYILDFWSTGCLSCIESFSKMDSLQKKYASSLNIILIGLEEKKRNIREFYGIYKEKFNLEIPTVFDSTTFIKFVHGSVPHLLWVNDQGIISAVTGSADVNEHNIQQFLNNEKFTFFDMSYKSLQRNITNFDNNKSLLINGNGGHDTSYLRRSIISFWTQGKGVPNFPAIFPYKASSNRYRYQVIGAPVQVLYVLAFFKANRELPNTYLDPQFSEGAREKIQENFGLDRRFNYCLEGPMNVSDTGSMASSMQNDLASFFGLKARVVYKPMPCYNLIVVDTIKFSKIVAEGGKKDVSWFAEKKVQVFKNIPLDNIIGWIKSEILEPKRLIAYNMTGTDVPVSFEMADIDITDLDSIRKGLRKVGLDLMPSTRAMRVIEVDVPKAENTQVN